MVGTCMYQCRVPTLHTLCMIHDQSYDDADVSDNKIFSVMQWQWQCLTARGKARWKQNTTRHDGRRGPAAGERSADGAGKRRGRHWQEKRAEVKVDFICHVTCACGDRKLHTAQRTVGGVGGVRGGGTRRLQSRRGRVGCLRMTLRL